MVKSVSFRGFKVRKGKWSVEWEYIGEGNSGDYGEEDGDTPRLRANLFYDDETVRGGSYCTLATPKTPKEELKASALALLKKARNTPNDFDSRDMEKWTWTKYSK